MQETRHWDEEAGRTRPGRRKEDADDYRYFQEPDLVPLEPEAAWLDGLRRNLPALPAARRAALAAAAGIDATDAGVALLVQRDQDALALAAIAVGADPARVLTHVEHDVPAEASATFDPAALAGVVVLEGERKLTATQAKKVLEVIAERGGSADPAAVAAELGFEAMAERRPRGPRRRGHRRQRRGVGEDPRRQRQGRRRHHRLRDEGHQGPGRRQGGRRDPRGQAGGDVIRRRLTRRRGRPLPMGIEVKGVAPAQEQEYWRRRASSAFGEDATEEAVADEIMIAEDDRLVAAYDGGTIVGTAAAYSFEMTLPGGRLGAGGRGHRGRACCRPTAAGACSPG